MTATAGLTYVMTVARAGPASLISSRKTTNATAVQTAPGAAREIGAPAEGSSAGLVSTAAGAYTSAASVGQTAVSWRDGTCSRWRAATSGARAQPRAVTSTSAGERALPPLSCGTGEDTHGQQACSGSGEVAWVLPAGRVGAACRAR
ncbi:hypothetical protein HUV60_024550 [Streptomyces sp. KMM 9044]|nr:hypothetical protein [Streptomyces sp. KMM 9044]WAX80353.1 hypothetical protein HUV60_024550 [Streptomyces sp. KMM 9044]